MTEFLQQVLSGLTLGSVYALVALGYTMIFGVLELIAFAQGGVFMIGAYVGLGIASALYEPAGPVVALVASLIGAAFAGAFANLLVDRVAYRPIRGATRLAPLLSGIGAYIFIENSVGVFLGHEAQPFPAMLPQGAIHVGGLIVTYSQITVIFIAVLAASAMALVVNRTNVGLSMRAVSERPLVARLMGIDSERTIMLTFMLGGALSAVGGVLVASFVGVATPTMGFLPGIKAFAAAVIGGIGNIQGALVGAIFVGLVETLGGGYVSPGWADAIVFGALILTLVFRPQGLLGTSVREKV